uniref:Homeodomain mating-type protein n=1 Tax=Coprinellus disseminatus TaxID=71703 RepID=Q1WMP3_COPDI|nr:homeodomain mating-type protein [Coprinellus disseminatus]
MESLSVDQDIVNSLDLIHAQFFSSLSGGLSPLKTFLSAWRSFDDKFQLCCDSLREDTRQKIYSFSSMVTSVVEGIFRTQSFCDDLADEASALLEGAAVASSPEATANTALPPYLKVASEWLATNLHNPYPSREVRTSMATRTNSSKKGIDNWFLDARKRIGWNELRRNHFDNKQINIVDAAKRFFLNADPSRPLPLVVESEFAKIQLCAQELYSNRFEESPLAARLDISITDMKIGLKVNTTENRSHKARTPSSTKAARLYPSPQPSPSGSPRPLSPVPTLYPLKRLPTPSRRGSSVPSRLKEGQEHPPRRRGSSTVVQRRSPSPGPQRSPVVASLPSPVPSALDETELQPPQHNQTASKLKRKRPSGAEGLPSPKRAHTASTSLQSQTVNPLPITSHETAEEFNWGQLLDFSTLPPPVSLFTVDDLAGPIDVSLFQFSPWEQYGYEELHLLREPAASSSSSTFDVGAIDNFSTQPAKPMDNGLSYFGSNPHGESSALLEELLSTKATGLYNLPNVSSDFVPLANQTTDPIAPPASTDCLANFPVPILMTPQAILAQAQVTLEPPVAIPKSGLQAKQEQLRLLQAQVAALAAEIASAS